MRISDWSSDVCSSDLFVNISGEYSNLGITSRQNQRPDAQALIDMGVQGVPVPAQRTGNPEAEAARLFVNAGVNLSDSTEFYAFGNYSWTAGTTAFFYRNPVTNSLFTSRSEEHTSELQSLMRISYAVFCLKKKITSKPHTT